VIRNAQGIGESHGDSGASMGVSWENGVPGKWRYQRQDPGLRQHPVRFPEPEGALRLILAWARPLCARSHAVHFATEQAYA
jgi:hypothetical protein